MTPPQTAIEVRDLRKSFKVPDQGPQTRRERLLHPARRRRPNVLEVLKGISFDVDRGEFFAIVGRNGSGKSTLLRLLASIYSPDGGTIRVRGTVAPLIELGIGFNPQLSARENVVLNGVMFGNSPQQMRRKIDAVLEFAELRDFGEMKLKNFSSGMRVRLAFAVMVETDPDILLIDEVLAVGDASFKQRCRDTFKDLKNRGKTIVLVTHQVATVEQDCDRAILLEAGEIPLLGSPREVVQGYFDLNLDRDGQQDTFELAEEEDLVPARRRATISDLRLIEPNGGQVATVNEKAPIAVRALVQARQAIHLAGLRVELRRARGARIFVSPDPAPGTDTAALEAGETAEVKAVMDNPLPPGRYVIRCTALSSTKRGISQASPVRPLTFDVGGIQRPGTGIVELGHAVSIEKSPAAGTSG